MSEKVAPSDSQNGASDSTRDCVLVLSREFSTNPETLFRYFTEPEHLANWFAPSQDLRTDVHELDLRVGGRYRISMVGGEPSKEHTVVGEYLEIERPHRLVYSWAWETEAENEVSQVELTFKQTQTGTRLEIRHERFNDNDSRDRHGQGWDGCLTRLESQFR